MSHKQISYAVTCGSTCEPEHVEDCRRNKHGNFPMTQQFNVDPIPPILCVASQNIESTRMDVLGRQTGSPT